MLNYSLFKVAGRSSGAPVVILTGPAVGPQSLTPRNRLAAAVGRLFSPRATAVAVGLTLALMTVHLLTSTSALDAQSRLAADTLLLTPWLVVWTARYLRTTEKGGEL